MTPREDPVNKQQTHASHVNLFMELANNKKEATGIRTTTKRTINEVRVKLIKQAAEIGRVETSVDVRENFCKKAAINVQILCKKCAECADGQDLCIEWAEKKLF